MIRRFAGLLLAAALLAAPFGAAAQKIAPVERAATEKGKEKEKAPNPAPEPSPPPYEPQLLRLSEVMGALTYLRGLCGERDAEIYRAKMAALLAAEATSDARKDRLAGAYNRGFQGYALTYRTCTPAARVVIARFLDEAARVSKDLANRYGG
ncbi:MAG TPA: TIGR02301 family protein [Roseiarcus sp.]|nr:TIGR02301 family protein [Roseiarcus sp.]